MEELQNQLCQLHSALTVASDDDKPALLSLIQDLQGLIDSVHVSNDTVHNTNEEHRLQRSTDDKHINETTTTQSTIPDADEEFFRFQQELNELEANTGKACIQNEGNDVSNQSENPDAEENSESDIQEELAALVGMKCKAPYEHHWGQVGFYNAIVFSVEPINLDSEDGICVRVIFMQPLSEMMRPCPFYLAGNCRFEESCKFSHGERIPLSHLKDYKEPDFSSLATGSKVLAKYKDDELWYRAVISEIRDSGDCEVKYENYPEKVIIPLSDTHPLYDEEYNSNNDSSDSESESDDGANEECNEEEEGTVDVPIVWVHMRGTSALGVWEQHTRGMGSKLMAKMGYVFGSGLGKNGEGRVEPVDAVIVPPGRSLDTIMKLKEKAGGNTSNLFSAERHLKRLQKRKDEQAARLEKRLKKSESVFNFLNDQLNLRKEKRLHSPISAMSSQQQHHKDTSVTLSKKLVSLGDSIKQVSKEISKCKESVKRHEGRDQITVERMTAKLSNLESHLSELKKTENKISSEQRHRSDKKKLTIF